MDRATLNLVVDGLFQAALDATKGNRWAHFAIYELQSAVAQFGLVDKLAALLRVKGVSVSD